VEKGEKDGQGSGRDSVEYLCGGFICQAAGPRTHLSTKTLAQLPEGQKGYCSLASPVSL